MIESLLIIALILVILDFFINTDLLTHCAYLLLTSIVYMEIEAQWFYKLLFAILSWFIIVAFHYLVWKRFMTFFSDKLIAPDKHQSGADGLIGKTGSVKYVDGVPMLKVADTLYEFHSTEKLQDCQLAEVTSVDGTILNVKYKGE